MDKILPVRECDDNDERTIGIGLVPVVLGLGFANDPFNIDIVLLPGYEGLWIIGLSDRVLVN